MKNDKPSDAALRTARLLRMKIHSMPPGKGVTEADNIANSKWLDEVSVEDAKLIDKETGLKELIEALDEIKAEAGVAIQKSGRLDASHPGMIYALATKALARAKEGTT